jgi:type II secretory pathway pseudopilin PulG
MFLQLQQESLVLGRRPLGFTEHYYTEWDDGLGKEKISLFLLISIGSTQVPGTEVAKEVFQLLQDHFLDDLSGDSYDRFESALREVNAMITEKEKELGLKFIPNVNVIIGVIQKDMVFLSQRGEAAGYLVRKRHVSSITEGLYDEKNKEELFQNIASGGLEVGDSVLFVTGPLIQYVTPNDLSKIFSEQPLSEAMKELDDLLQNDMEDQMTLLSFEVLEKTEEMLAPAAHGMVVDGKDEPDMEEDEEERRPVPSPLHADEDRPKPGSLSKSLENLRKFMERKENWRFLDQFRGKDRKKVLIAMGVIGLVLVAGVYGLVNTLNGQRSRAAMEEKLATAEENIAQAETRGAFDKAEASALLDQAEKLAVEVLDSGYAGGEASQMLDKIEDARNTLDNVQIIDDEQIALVVDLSDRLAGSVLQGLELYGDRMVAYTDQKAYQILIDQVQEPDVIDTTDKVVAGAFFDEMDNIVFLTAASKVIEYTDGNSQFADTAEVNWHSGVSVATYSSKIYILDPASNQIWRYQRGTESYGSAQAYFSSEIDLSDAVSIAVDGKMWVLKSDGTLLKYLSGEPVEYQVKKAPLNSFEGATKVFTELESNQVYILDSEDDRLFIFDKNGKNDDLTYNAQYVFEDLKGTLVDFTVDKDRNKLLLLTTEALYEMNFGD